MSEKTSWGVSRLEELAREEARRRLKTAMVRRVELLRTSYAYTRAVDALIPLAEGASLEEVGPEPTRWYARRAETQEWKRWAEKFDRAFHRHMDALCLSKGLRRQSHQ